MQTTDYAPLHNCRALIMVPGLEMCTLIMVPGLEMCTLIMVPGLEM